MGRGNWFPGNNDTPRSLVYVNLSMDEDNYKDEDGSVDYDTMNAAENERCSELIDMIYGKLPDSFDRAENDSWQQRLWADTYGHTDSRLLFYNRLVAVVADPEGENFHLGIAVCPLPLDQSEYSKTRLMYPLAVRQYQQVADSLWEQLEELKYKMSVRTSAWTSAPRAPTVAERAA